MQLTILDDDDGAGCHSVLVTEEGGVLNYAMMRGTLQYMLHKGLAEDHGLGVMFGRRMLGILYASLLLSSSLLEGIMCKFDEGLMAGPYNLVVSCDGIQSATFLRRFPRTRSSWRRGKRLNFL